MFSPSNYLTGVMHPEGFHGKHKTNNFFEGWYIKLVSEDQSQKWAIIPGIFRGLQGSDVHEAFVQVLDGSTGRSWYHRYPIEEFEAAPDRFQVRVGNNEFSNSSIKLDLEQLKGEISIDSDFKPWPVTLASPGIMGWYGLVPMMECFHGIVSFNHKISGELDVEGTNKSLAGGKGYIEKDWGKNFPAGYLWLHSNHLASDPEASLVSSAAIIPWVGNSFRGFIMGFSHSGKLHSWTTYNKSKELKLDIQDEHIEWVVEGPDGRLELFAERKRGGLLHAPLRDQMHQRVEETMDTTINLTHTKNNQSLRSGIMTSGAMEVYGDIEKLLKIRKR